MHSRAAHATHLTAAQVVECPALSWALPHVQYVSQRMYRAVACCAYSQCNHLLNVYDAEFSDFGRTLHALSVWSLRNTAIILGGWPLFFSVRPTLPASVPIAQRTCSHAKQLSCCCPVASSSRSTFLPRFSRERSRLSRVHPIDCSCTNKPRPSCTVSVQWVCCPSLSASRHMLTRSGKIFSWTPKKLC